ncbi:DUF1800 domain-containing protein [Phenylobacterium sp.]|uniref:DUF1800 domain-containing protein n=1 Tax=Phenylobacterium sp. TaxID=1871053 RepID=UPI002CC77C14|nr:DUF1800 family protein [Phenylobacterium sp.]HLZ74929.1 DUF1800 family protein [Phenylobacterium sp.]
MATSGQSTSTNVAVGVAAVGAVAAGVALAPMIGKALSGSGAASTPQSAAAFLNRATFGATDASIAALSDVTTWFADQAKAAPTPGGAQGYWATTPSFHLDWVQRRQADFDAAYQAAVAAAGPNPTTKINHQRVKNVQFQEGFWARAVTGDDQLRHRMTLALSEIFVVSFVSSTITPRIAASWYDMLSAHALGNYLDLLKAVTLHPAMGLYLNTTGNTQADNDPTRHPDENYGREVMQLMSIGLVKLDANGQPQTDATGAAIATYTHDDIAGLAKVFTGWGWYNARPSQATFAKQPADGTTAASPDVQTLISYPANHSQLSKTFLGTTIAAYTGPQPTTQAGANALTAYQTASLSTALTTIANHPNVGPFIGRRLIQRFVTSNPSPAYVGRVAAAFNGDPLNPATRGDLMATVKAVLTDPEALDQAGSLASSTSGKLREPVMRMTQWLRASGATSKATATAPNGNFQQFADFGDPGELAQAPLEAPTVFNFFDPDYVPTGSAVAKAGLVAPEFQAVDALTVASYANLMAQVIQLQGWPGKDVTTAYANELAALTPASPTAPDNNQALIDRINLIYFAGTMSTTMSARLLRVLNGAASLARAPTAAQIAQVRLNKVQNALIIALTSPEFVVQR